MASFSSVVDIFYFGGEPTVIQISDHSHALHRFYDLSWNRLPIWFRDVQSLGGVSVLSIRGHRT